MGMQTDFQVTKDRIFGSSDLIFRQQWIKDKTPKTIAALTYLARFVFLDKCTIYSIYTFHKQWNIQKINFIASPCRTPHCSALMLLLLSHFCFSSSFSVANMSSGLHYIAYITTTWTVVCLTSSDSLHMRFIFFFFPFFEILLVCHSLLCWGFLLDERLKNVFSETPTYL